MGISNRKLEKARKTLENLEDNFKYRPKYRVKNQHPAGPENTAINRISSLKLPKYGKKNCPIP